MLVFRKLCELIFGTGCLGLRFIILRAFGDYDRSLCICIDDDSFS